MNDVTLIIQAIDRGDPHAAEQLLPLVYDELRKLAAARMAQESPDHTLQATALVHEAYVRLVDVAAVQHWSSRGHFFGAAAEAMRRILIETARRKGRQKRLGGLVRHDVQNVEVVMEDTNFDLLDLDDVLTKFAQEHPEKARLVNLRVFAGMELAEIAEILGVSPSTVDRHWKYARAWLSRALSDTPPVHDLNHPRNHRTPA